MLKEDSICLKPNSNLTIQVSIAVALGTDSQERKMTDSASPMAWFTLGSYCQIWGEGQDHVAYKASQFFWGVGEEILQDRTMGGEKIVAISTLLMILTFFKYDKM